MTNRVCTNSSTLNRLGKTSSETSKTICTSIPHTKLCTYKSLIQKSEKNKIWNREKKIRLKFGRQKKLETPGQKTCSNILSLKNIEFAQLPPSWKQGAFFCPISLLLSTPGVFTIPWTGLLSAGCEFLVSTKTRCTVWNNLQVTTLSLRFFVTLVNCITANITRPNDTFGAYIVCTLHHLDGGETSKPSRN